MSSEKKPAPWVITSTARSGRRRVWRPPRKSPTPQVTLDASARTTAATAAYPGEGVNEPACTDRGRDRRRRERVGHDAARRRAGGQAADAVRGDRHGPAAHAPPLPPPAQAERALAGPARAAARRSGELLRPAPWLLRGGA